MISTLIYHHYYPIHVTHINMYMILSISYISYISYISSTHIYIYISSICISHSVDRPLAVALGAPGSTRSARRTPAPRRLTQSWRSPSEQYEFVTWDDDIPNIRENKIHVPNHQPVYIYILLWQIHINIRMYTYRYIYIYTHYMHISYDIYIYTHDMHISYDIYIYTWHAYIVWYVWSILNNLKIIWLNNVKQC